MSEKAREFLRSFKVAIMRKSPFFAFMLSTFRVSYVDADDPRLITCRGNEIRIYRNALGDERVFGLRMLKALIHVSLGHGLRAVKLKKKHREIINIDSFIRFAAEVVVYNLFPDRLKPKEFNWDDTFLERLFGKDWRSKSMEEIFYQLVDNAKKVSVPVFSSNLEVGEEKRNEPEAVPLQDGDSNLLIGKEVNEAELEKVIKDVEKRFKDNLIKSSMIGAGLEESSGLRQILEELLKEKPLPWNVILRRYLQGWHRKHFLSSWRRLSRKSDMLPGLEQKGFPRIVVAVDVSGSISDEEYGKFCREVLEIAKTVSVEFVCWDTKAVHYGEVEKLSDLERKEVAGYGGTLVTSLKKILMDDAKLRVRPADLLVILTDGHWYEGEREAENFVKSLRCKKILLTTGKVHGGFDRVIKMEGGDQQ